MGIVSISAMSNFTDIPNALKILLKVESLRLTPFSMLQIRDFCDLLCVGHHKCSFYEIEFFHYFLGRGGKMMFLALSSIVESTFLCLLERRGVGNLPLRSASSENIRASSPQSSGDVLIDIAIFSSY